VAKYKYKNNAKQAIYRAKISHSDKVASLLFETFLENRGKIKSAEVYRKGICKKNDFTKWRTMLCEKGWLIFELSSDGKSSNYYPGKKLLKYINKEKQESYEIATTKELNDVESEHNKLKKEYEEFKEETNKKFDRVNVLVDEYINKIDPITNDAKRKKYHRGGYDNVVIPLKSNKKKGKNINKKA
jgi:hypothetical protein